MHASSVVDIRNTFGAALIGLIVSTVLFGLTAVQAWIYYWTYGDRDAKPLKLFIAFLIVMDGFHTALCVYTVYWYLILNFGNPENLQYTIWSMDVQVPISILVSGPVQFYYARRVHILSGSIICPIVIVALSLICSSLGFLFTIKLAVIKEFSRSHSLAWIMCVGLTSGALADLLIAAAMCWSLYRRRTGFARTDSIIMSLMTYSINSGLLVSILAGTMTIVFVVLPTSMVYMAIFWTMSKCYVNSLLAMLNSRNYVRDRSTTDNPENAVNLSTIRIEPSGDDHKLRSGQPGVSVTVHRSTRFDFGRSISDHDEEPTFDVAKPDASLTVFHRQDQMSDS